MSIKPLRQIEVINAAVDVDQPAPARAASPLVPQRAKRSLLAGPSRGLAWSNPDISDEALVRNALMTGAYHLVLEAVLEHSLAVVRLQWALIEADSELGLTALARAEINRKLSNIERGMTLAAA
jgi:hypothetical protein